MECYLKLNSLILVVAFCLFVTALGSDNRDQGDEDPLSIPLINDKGAPLVAMLDTNTINRKIKVYIRTLMRDMIQSSIREQIKRIFKTSLEENSTVDFIRNITLQEIYDATKQQGQEVAKYKDCTELQRQTKEKLNDGVYTIYPGGDNPVQAYCDMTTDGGGWTVMLKRFDGSVNFKRTWVECENGFGDIHAEFWLGNKYTYMLTSSGKYELRVDMVDRWNNTKYAVYKTFVIGDAASKYKLTVGDYSGTAGDRFKNNNGMKFTTVDQDNDIEDYRNCAVGASGTWWYNDCGESDLTPTNYKPYWGNEVSKPVMMIRKI